MNFTESYKDLFEKKLASLGVAFNEKSAAQPADPEITIIESLKYFFTDKNYFDFIIGLTEHRLHPLINVERLVALGKNLDDERLNILVSLCDRISTLSPRYKYAVNELKSKIKKEVEIPEVYAQERLIKKWGEDSHFKKFNISVPNFFGEKSAKFYNMEHILKHHPWLRIRALIGPNYRADIVYLKSSGLAGRPQNAAKILGCTRATAYLIYNSLADTPFIEGSDFFTRVG